MDYQRVRYLTEGGVSLLLIVFGTILYVKAPSFVSGWAFNIPGTTDVALAPDFFPRLSAILIIVAALGVLFTMRMRIGPLPILDTTRQAYGRSIAGFCAILSLALLIPVTGFVVTSAVFVMVVAAVGGYRNWLILVPVSIAAPLILWFVFRYGLYVGLPHGYFF